jgi:hypothetical protein
MLDDTDGFTHVLSVACERQERMDRHEIYRVRVSDREQCVYLTQKHLHVSFR